jgi:ABC-2 type transport system ATP-binding protein
MEYGKVERVHSCEEYMEQIVGCVWNLRVSVDELVAFQNRAVISNVVPHGGEMEVRVIDEKKPSDDAVPAAPNLEDAYLYIFNYLPLKAAA